MVMDGHDDDNTYGHETSALWFYHEPTVLVLITQWGPTKKIIMIYKQKTSLRLVRAIDGHDDDSTYGHKTGSTNFYCKQHRLVLITLCGPTKKVSRRRRRCQADTTSWEQGFSKSLGMQGELVFPS
jgi:hypothetical protein